MVEEIPSKVITATREVFETMFYATVEAQPDEEGNRESLSQSISSWIAGEIRFEGRYCGRMIFFVPTELALTMASNFMGLEVEAVSSSQARDVVGELCNMVCGNLFSKLDRREVWTLAPPQTWENSEPFIGSDGSPPTVSIPLCIEGYPVQLEIRLTPAGGEEKRNGYG